MLAGNGAPMLDRSSEPVRARGALRCLRTGIFGGLGLRCPPRPPRPRLRRRHHSRRSRRRSHRRHLRSRRCLLRLRRRPRPRRPSARTPPRCPCERPTPRTAHATSPRSLQTLRRRGTLTRRNLTTVLVQATCGGARRAPGQTNFRARMHQGTADLCAPRRTHRKRFVRSRSTATPAGG